MQGIHRRLHSDRVFTGRIIDVVVDQVEMENGGLAVREVVEHPGGAVVLAVDDDGKIIFVRQPRYPVNLKLLELPAGKRDQGEAPEITARRELEEETGLQATRMIHLVSFYTSPGICNEELHLYLADGVKIGKINLEHDEMITLERYSLEEALHMVRTAAIKDAKTILGILWLNSFPFVHSRVDAE